jgi:membrane associated rhomboid family serine protease
MFFPYSTDAPVYYWPFATVGLIAVNVIVFFGVASGSLSSFEDWALTYGNGLHPDEWFRAMFMHGSVEHLLGNMLFLWVFGLVVEGKLGWWKFLCCYLAIGATQSMIEQVVMLGYDGEVPGSVGASAAIFGLVAMAAVWAPVNEVTFFYLIFVRAGTFDVSIAMLAAIYAGMEVLLLLVSGGTAGSSWLHLGGFALGMPLGIALLKRKIVDCEGWDMFHVWRGDYGSFKKEPAPAEVFAKADAHQQSRNEKLLSDAKQQFRIFLEQGNPLAALRLSEKMKESGSTFTLARDELLKIVQALHAAKRWQDSAPYMAEFIERFPEQADAMRIKLAQICVVELQRPGKALDLLAAVDKSKLPEQHSILVKRITAKAHALEAEGVVELDVETW